jgi:hypothetical protein
MHVLRAENAGTCYMNASYSLSVCFTFFLIASSHIKKLSLAQNSVEPDSQSQR